MDNRTIKARINKSLSVLNRVYHEAIPMGDIFEVIRRFDGEPMDEDGSKWSGILCGDEGTARIAISGLRCTLMVQWFRMQSGRYELNAYVS